MEISSVEMAPLALSAPTPRLGAVLAPHPARVHRYRAVPTRSLVAVRAADQADDEPTTVRLVDPPIDATKKKRVKAVKTCKACDGVGVVECRACKGVGTLAAGGFHSKNHVDMANVVGTNWTAHVRTKGWRHFEAIGKSPADKTNGKPRASVHLAATCDRDITVWVDVKELKDRNLWSAGWKQREDLDWIGDPDQPGGAVARPKPGAACVVCDGDGKAPCQRKGCVNGAERIRKQKEVIERTEKTFKKVIKATRLEDGGEGGGDEAAGEMRRRMKRQLKDMAKAKPGRRGAKGRADPAVNANNGEEDWGAWGRKRRDEKLDKWMRAGTVPEVDWPDDEDGIQSKRRGRSKGTRRDWDEQQ